MRRIFYVLLALVLTLTALSACSKSNIETSTTTAANTTAEPETSTENTTEEVTDLSVEQTAELTVKEFLDVIKDKDIKGLVKLIGDNYYDKASEEKALKAYSFFKDINIESYEITGKEYVGDINDTPLFIKITLNISKSGSTLFPVGKSRWILRVDDGGYKISFFKPENKKNKIIYSDEQDYVIDFCFEFSEIFYCFETVNDFNTLIPDIKDKDSFNWFCDGLMAMLPLEYKGDFVSRKDIEMQAKKVFGITGVDFKKFVAYNAKNDTLMICAHGFFSGLGTLSSKTYDPKTNLYTVVIDYYSDSAYILKAITMKYTVRRNKDGSLTLISTQKLMDTGVNLKGEIN